MQEIRSCLATLRDRYIPLHLVSGETWGEIKLWIRSLTIVVREKRHHDPKILRRLREQLAHNIAEIGLEATAKGEATVYGKRLLSLGKLA